jgi:hypothetical protein
MIAVFWDVLLCNAVDRWVWTFQIVVWLGRWVQTFVVWLGRWVWTFRIVVWLGRWVWTFVVWLGRWVWTIQMSLLLPCTEEKKTNPAGCVRMFVSIYQTV